ncbi:MAG: hypothetical protein AABX54_00595 [Nanoarchaeota archaeon]
MKKRGQITVFVILAIVLITAGGIAYYLTKNTNTIDDYFSHPDVKPGMDNIKNSVYECMKTTCSDSLDIIGIQGGYYKQPQEFFDLKGSFLPYYYNRGNFLMPATSEIQNQLGLYVDDNLNSCLENIKISDFSLSYTKPKTKAIINKEDVTFKIDMPILVKKTDKTTRLELKDNSVSIQSKLFEMLEIAKFITDSHKEDPNRLCINCILNIAKERNLYVYMAGFDYNNTIFISISANQTNVFPSVFQFLNKYSEV